MERGERIEDRSPFILLCSSVITCICTNYVHSVLEEKLNIVFIFLLFKNPQSNISIFDCCKVSLIYTQVKMTHLNVRVGVSTPVCLHICMHMSSL